MKSKEKTTLFACVSIAVVLVGGLWGVDLQGTLTVSDITDDHIGKTVCVNGNVKTGTLAMSDDGAIVTFTLTDGNNDVDVVYHKAQPLNLQNGMPATVTGVLQTDRTIDAHRVLSECPSKYETENVTFEYDNR